MSDGRITKRKMAAITSIRIKYQYSLVSASGEDTFAGILVNHFFPNQQNGDHGISDRWADSTTENYCDDYRVRLIKAIPRLKAISEIKVEELEEAIDFLVKRYDYQTSTENHYRLLVRVVFEAASRAGYPVEENVWGSVFYSPINLPTVIETKFLAIPKSLTAYEAVSLFATLTADIENAPGEDMGLLIMMFTGCRNEEAVPINFNHFFGLGNTTETNLIKEESSGIDNDQEEMTEPADEENGKAEPNDDDEKFLEPSGEEEIADEVGDSDIKAAETSMDVEKPVEPNTDGNTHTQLRVEVKKSSQPKFFAVFESGTRTRNTTKSGGKSRNAYRFLPVPSVLWDLIVKRKEAVKNAIDTNELDAAEDIDQFVESLPVSCYKSEYEKRCVVDDLSRRARHHLREMKYESEWLATFEAIMISERRLDNEIDEKEPTAYLLRRFYATMLYILGFTNIEQEYLMGHAISSSEADRRDYTNEDLQLLLWEKMEAHPLCELVRRYGMEAFSDPGVVQKIRKDLKVVKSHLRGEAAGVFKGIDLLYRDYMMALIDFHKHLRNKQAFS
ncbi:MAG: hypothetical protein ACOYI6_08730 [Christensenellales bacterium]|nr:hypothetical protein [Chloroflexota bacterium]